MRVCNCSMFCCTLLYVHSSIAIILMGKRELIALLILSSWCLVMVERLFLAVPRGCLQFVIVVFPDHTYDFWHDPLHFLILVLAMSNQLMDEVCPRDLSLTNHIGQFRRKTMLNLAFIIALITRSVQSTPADNTRKRVWQYIEKERKRKGLPCRK